MSNEELEQLENQVREMARLSILANKINPIQEMNLKMFPMVFFNGVKKVRIDYDLFVDRSEEGCNTTPKHSVKYHLEIDETQDNSKLDVRLEHLKRSVWNLFWPNIEVQVFFNDRLVNKGNENEQSTKTTG